MLCLVAHLCLTLCDPMDCSQASLSMEILQARILKWVDVPFSRESSKPRDQTQVSHIAGRFFTIWATREAPCSSQQVKYKWCHVTALLNLPPRLLAPSEARQGPNNGSEALGMSTPTPSYSTPHSLNSNYTCLFAEPSTPGIFLPQGLCKHCSFSQWSPFPIYFQSSLPHLQGSGLIVIFSLKPSLVTLST